jgi:hypothetical protein
VLLATNKIGAQPGDTFVGIATETQLAQPVSARIDRAPNDNPSPANYRLGGNASCSPLPVELLSAASSETHTNAGPLFVTLPAAGKIGVESRGANGSYTMIFRFTNPLLSVGGVSLTSGSGTITSSAIDGADPSQYVINLSGVANAQVVTVRLTNVVDAAGNISKEVSSVMGVLEGDCNGDGVVNQTDVNETAAHIGQTISASNFRSDVNRDGHIDSDDVAAVTGRLGSSFVRVTSSEKASNGKYLLRGVGIPSKAHPVQATDNLLQPFGTIGTATADAAGNFQFEDTVPAATRQRFYRLIIP